MSKNLKYSFLLLFSVSVVFSFCGKIEKLPETPEITFIDQDLVDTVDALGNVIKRMDIEVYLVDGDGNIGLFYYDTISPSDTSKFYIFEYRKKNGVFVQQDYEEPQHFRLPYLQPRGQDKTLRCTIRVEVSYTEPEYSEMDTVQYRLFVVDRSEKKSNVITTPEIIFGD